MLLQRVIKMNKTEDDEITADELTEEELRQVAGESSSEGGGVEGLLTGPIFPSKNPSL